MGWVVMSERELKRVEVLAQVDDGRLSVDNAANMLALTRRQIFRLLKLYRQDGASAIRHKARGKPPNNRIHKAKRDYALSLSWPRYSWDSFVVATHFRYLVKLFMRYPHGTSVRFRGTPLRSLANRTVLRFSQADQSLSALPQGIPVLVWGPCRRSSSTNGS
jgi:hypothetical protein|nr:helix-turn-helix domain-containing protein [Sulfitobacter sp. EhC04]